MSETFIRILTGIGLIIMVIVGTTISNTVFFIVFGIVALLCLVEYFNVVFSNNQLGRVNIFRKIVGVVLGMFPLFWMVLFLDGSEWINSPVALSLAIIPFFLLMIFELFANAPDPVKNLSFTIFGVLYISIPFTLLFYLQDLYHPTLILGIVLLVFTNDSLAYVFGKWKGKTPLFPRISPKKTWEGAIGGSLITVGVAAAYPFLFYPNGPFFWDWIVMVLLIIVLGPIGDLTESMIKRNFDIKDSGSLLPGHGGFLDRFDALIFIIPFITAYLLAF